ncbi:MAG TPA: BON domain-containing protein [Thermomicrobiaceae bacterium]|nr:BON domain-containing protein [Thermomicrobiaceae bacterium]
MRQSVKLAGTSLAAAGLMYFLDPDHGRRRRALARDQAIHAGHRGIAAACATRRDLRNRTVGLAMRLPPLSSLAVPEMVPDAVLAERIRARLGRLVAHPGALEVAVSHGHVVMSGQVLRAEVRRLLGSVGRMPGVLSVESRLDVHEEAGRVAGLQGGPGRVGSRVPLLRERLSPTERLGVGLLGAGLLLAARRVGPLGLGLAIGGVAALARALTNVGPRQLAGTAARLTSVGGHANESGETTVA